MSEALQWLLGMCAGLITLVTAGEKAKSLFSPVTKAAKRLDVRLDEHEATCAASWRRRRQAGFCATASSACSRPPKRPPRPATRRASARPRKN